LEMFWRLPSGRLGNVPLLCYRAYHSMLGWHWW
jgi:hypothetical protein